MVEVVSSVGKRGRNPVPERHCGENIAFPTETRFAQGGRAQV